MCRRNDKPLKTACVCQCYSRSVLSKLILDAKTSSEHMANTRGDNRQTDCKTASGNIKIIVLLLKRWTLNTVHHQLLEVRTERERERLENYFPRSTNICWQDYFSSHLIQTKFSEYCEDRNFSNAALFQYFDCFSFQPGRACCHKRISNTSLIMNTRKYSIYVWFLYLFPLVYVIKISNDKKIQTFV